MNPTNTPKPLLDHIYRRKILWLIIVCTLVTVSVIIIPRVATPNPAVDSKHLALRVMLGAIFFVAAFNWRSLIKTGWTAVDTLFAGLSVSFLVSSLLSGRIVYCLVQYWHLGGLFALGWVVYRLKPTLNECNSLVRIGGLLGLLSALYGFLTFIGLDPLREFYPFDFTTNEGGRNFIHSFFGNPEYFGGFAAPSAVLLVGLALQPKLSILRRVWWIGSAGFVLAVLALSGSRGAFLGFVAGTALLFFGQVGLLSKRMRIASWSISIAALLALAIGSVILSTPNPLNPRDMRLLQRFGDLFNTQTDSIRERLLFYTSTASAIPDNFIFGYGPGTYRLEFFNNVKLLVEQDERASTYMLLQNLNRRLAEHTHNDYLEIWFEYGVIGFGLFLFLLTYSGVRFVRGRWFLRSRIRSEAHLSVPTATYVTIFAAVTTIMINALTSFPLHMPARGTLAWVLIGSFFAIDRIIYEALARETGTEKASPPLEKVDK